MYNVGGNWSRLDDRPEINTNEHVYFFAKVRCSSDVAALMRV